MRLIDADSLRDEFENDIELDRYWACETIDKWPTIKVNNMEWISTKDRLPELGVEVLCYADNNKMYILELCQWVFKKWHKYFSVTGEFEDRQFGIDEIIAWMPLPNPPEE